MLQQSSGAEPAPPWELWVGVGMGLALHALTWANLFSGIHHRPSGWLVAATLSLYPGLVQWVYLLPAVVVARLRRRDAAAKGIVWVGLACLLFNVTAAVLLSIRR